MKRHQASIVLGLIVVAITGCTARGEGGHAGSSSVLTRAEIEESSYSNAMDLIQAERPQWLRIRGAPSIETPQYIVVYVDGIRRGTREALRRIPVANIEEMRHLTGREAQFKYGTDNALGAIEIITRSRR